MFAVAFDLVVADTRKHHPVGVTAAYREIGDVLAKYGFIWTQGSLYLLKNKDLTSIQWSRNGTPIAGATSKTLTLFPVSLDDKGALFGATVWALTSRWCSSKRVIDSRAISIIFWW